MKQAIVTQDENIRLTELEDCEHKIVTALRRGLEASVQIGLQLRKINEKELYLERGYKNFQQYCSDYQRLDHSTAYRLMGISQSVQVLKEAGLPLPDNESQVAELARLELDKQPEAWKRIVDAAEAREEPVTRELVRFTVQQAVAEDGAAKPTTVPKASAKSSLEEPDLDLGSNVSADEPKRSKGSTGAPPPQRISLSEDGEKALDRIRRTCGDVVADAIEYKRLEITERDLIRWNEQEDPARLVHCVCDLRYTVPKAIEFIDQTISGSTPVRRLVLLAQANGGQYKAEFEQANITVIMATLVG